MKVVCMNPTDEGKADICPGGPANTGGGSPDEAQPFTGAMEGADMTYDGAASSEDLTRFVQMMADEKHRRRS